MNSKELNGKGHQEKYETCLFLRKKDMTFLENI